MPWAPRKPVPSVVDPEDEDWTPDPQALGDRFQVPCGQWFPDEVVAGDHYMRCDRCDRIHKRRHFRAYG